MSNPKSSESKSIVLRPGVTNPSLWYPERPPKVEWDRIRKIVLDRDNFTCHACGHRALKYMNVHHLEETGENTPENQVEIVQRTRDGIRNGMLLPQINKTFKLKRGPHPPDSILYPNELVHGMGKAARAYLPEPLSAVFVNLSRWQLE